MPRRTRIHLDKVPLRVVQRVRHRPPGLFTEKYSQAILHWLVEALQKRRCRFHAYVLMTQHGHLLTTSMKADAVPRLLLSLSRCVQCIDETYRRSDTLWHSRYQSPLMQAESDVLAGQRYIDLNHIRAEMVNTPAECRWSSYRRHALRQPDSSLLPHPMHFAIAQTDCKKQAAYRAVFRSALDQQAVNDLSLALQPIPPLDDRRFYAKVESLSGKRRTTMSSGRSRVETDQPTKAKPKHKRPHFNNPKNIAGAWPMDFPLRLSTAMETLK